MSDKRNEERRQSVIDHSKVQTKREIAYSNEQCVGQSNCHVILFYLSLSP